MGWFSGSLVRLKPTTGYGVVRCALALILLVAAGLKTHQLATSPVLGDGLLDSRWLLMATVEFELFFGLWLLSGLLPRLTWAAALGCFALFACVSFYKAASGASSCGCFGRVEVNPWYTFTLDTICVLALLQWRPLGASSLVPSRAILLRGMVVMGAWLAVGVPAAWAMGTYEPSLLGVDGIIVGDDNLVILEPEKWVGKRFPLLPFIEDVPGQSKPGERPLREQLAEGKWIVVLYHHDCPECQKAMPKYETLARRSAADPTAPHLAMVEVPPCGDANSFKLSSRSPCSHGRLSNKKDWLVQTPVAFLVIHVPDNRDSQEAVVKQAQLM